MAKVAAVNCDEETNKPLCGSMGVQGFPTLKIVRPGKKPGKPFVEDYQGARSAKAIVDSVVDKISNHVKRIGDKTVDDWLKEGNDTAKAILFTEKGTTSALLRALAIDFLGSISIAQIRDKESKAVGIFGVDEFPKLVVLPGGEKEALVYDGELKKAPMVEFLSQVASPNPDPAPEKAKAKKPDTKKLKKEKVESTSTVTVEEAKSTPSSTDDKPEPADPSTTPQIPTLDTQSDLNKACLHTKAPTCILALLPTDPSSPSAQSALTSLSSIASKHAKRRTNLFLFFTLPASNPGASTLRSALKLSTADTLELVATNAKRSWYKRFAGGAFGQDEVEAWIDGIRMGEGKKEKLPASVVSEEVPEVKEDRVKLEVKEGSVKFESADGTGTGSAAEGLKVEFLEEVLDGVVEEEEPKPEATPRKAKEEARETDHSEL